MQLAVMAPAERDREHITDLEADRSWLGKVYVVRVGWLPSTDGAWLRRHEFEMCLVAQTLWFADRQLALVDPGRSSQWRDRLILMCEKIILLSRARCCRLKHL
jgi:hypothetical protein